MAIYIIIGVSGVGKTTIGKLLGEALGLSFYDADDFHSDENIGKMTAGQPLTDRDREPWLQRLADNMVSWQREGGGVLACSALKESYRAILSKKDRKHVKWIYLHQELSMIEERVKNRPNHFFKKEMLQSQFDALEEPQYGLKVDVSMSPEEIIKFIKKSLKLK